MATTLTGPFVALAAAMCVPSGDQEQRRKYVVRGENRKESLIVASRTKLLTWSWAVELGAGGVNRQILTVLSSLAVAKYLLAGSNTMPLT
jgi:hypothetical protein